ncbi:MAG: precorrin-3B C(17)-methyltransferase [Treponema sp.]|nr:precorrin-3B C(17)-methyltransferase [Treponema sp.]
MNNKNGKKIYVVGLGPGNQLYMSEQAKTVLASSDIIVGYKTYVELVKPVYPDKDFLSTGMTHEIERCRMAFEEAEKGKSVSMVCSGDAGVYGMASPVLELAKDYPDVDIEIVSGISAVLSGAAILGAPVSHDFAVISLSDALTPLDIIEKRLTFASQADLCIALYNPVSHRRKDSLIKACDVLLKYLSPDTVCGWVRNIGREGQEYKICSLKELKNESLDMFCTVFIGNSTTKKIVLADFSERMVTPRGYQNKYDI